MHFQKIYIFLIILLRNIKLNKVKNLKKTILILTLFLISLLNIGLAVADTCSDTCGADFFGVDGSEADCEISPFDTPEGTGYVEVGITNVNDYGYVQVCLSLATLAEPGEHILTLPFSVEFDQITTSAEFTAYQDPITLDVTFTGTEPGDYGVTEAGGCRGKSGIFLERKRPGFSSFGRLDSVYQFSMPEIGEAGYTPPGGEVPEFSTIGVVLALIAVIALVVFKKKKNSEQ